MASRGAEPREFLPARYPHDAEEAAKANIAKGSIPDAGLGILSKRQRQAPQSQLRRKRKQYNKYRANNFMLHMNTSQFCFQA